MNSTEVLIAVAYGLVTLAGFGLAFALAFSTLGRKRPVDEQRMAHRERAWLYVVIAIMLALLFATIWFTPYGRGGTDGDVVVNVQSRQFLWTVKPNTVPANRRIEFRMTSDDVSHGFGIYDSRDHFVAQAQVVPGKTQKLAHTFTRPGTYQVLCLEFCGFGHAQMRGQFTVTP
jgi:cytochrome c oxidase subunit 2